MLPFLFTVCYTFAPDEYRIITYRENTKTNTSTARKQSCLWVSITPQVVTGSRVHDGACRAHLANNPRTRPSMQSPLCAKAPAPDSLSLKDKKSSTYILAGSFGDERGEVLYRVSEAHTA